MAGEDALAGIKKDLEFLNSPPWKERLLGVLLYGSRARGEASPGSDIDLCIVLPQTSGRAALWREFVSHLRDQRYEVRIFEMLPLHIKIAVIEEGVVLHSRDAGALGVFLPFPQGVGGPEAQAYTYARGDEISDCRRQRGKS